MKEVFIAAVVSGVIGAIVGYMFCFIRDIEYARELVEIKNEQFRRFKAMSKKREKRMIKEMSRLYAEKNDRVFWDVNATVPGDYNLEDF